MTDPQAPKERWIEQPVPFANRAELLNAAEPKPEWIDQLVWHGRYEVWIAWTDGAGVVNYATWRCPSDQEIALANLKATLTEALQPFRRRIERLIKRGRP